MRPKDDADRLQRERRERRELIDSVSDGDFDEISEVTNPAIHLHVAPPPRVEEAPLPPPRSPLPSSDLFLGTVDRLPKQHRLWAVLAAIAAVLAAVLAGKLILK